LPYKSQFKAIVLYSTADIFVMRLWVTLIYLLTMLV